MAHEESASSQPLLLTPTEVAQLLQLDAQALRRMRQAGDGPEFHRIGGQLLRYRTNAVKDWREGR